MDSEVQKAAVSDSSSEKLVGEELLVEVVNHR